MSELGLGRYFICGGFGGMCTVLVGHPLDTIKVRLQTMPKPKPGEKPIYAGTFDCFTKTVKSEGVLGLYKGMVAPLISMVPIFAISFLSYGTGKKLFGPKNEGEKFKYYQFFLAGSFSALFTTMVMSPGERIKCLLQIQGDSKEKKYNGPMDAALKLYKEGGIASIYRGVGATLARDVPASGAYFLAYEATKDVLTNYGEYPPSFLATIFAGGNAGVANWLVGMPQDVVKSRLQTAPEGSYKGGMREVFFELLKNDGPLALYRGLTPVLLRAFPANAACFVGFEACSRFLTMCFG